MRKMAYWLVAFFPLLLQAASLPVGPQGKQEAELYMYVIQAVLEDKDTQKACQYYKQAWQISPKSKFLRRQMLACALEQNNLSLADLYSDYIEEGENGAEDLSVYAFYQWRKGDLNLSRTYYEQALAKNPDDARILYQYILLLGYIDVDLAVEILQERKAQHPSLAAVIDVETGNIYKNKKDFAKALSYYQLAIQEDPYYPNAYLARAEIYEKQSQFFFMLHELEALEKIGYEDPTVYSRMGSVFMLVRDENKARMYFEKAKQLEKGNIPAGYFLALLAERNGEFKQASCYLREMADFQTNSGRWLQAAFYEQRAGDTQAALDLLKEAYKIFDKNIEIAYFYSLILQDEGRCRQSAQILKEILHTNPDYEKARLAYAFALESCKKYKEMEKQVRQVLVQNPENAAAYNLLGFSLAQRNIRLEEALELVTRALAISPQDRAFMDSLAWIYYQQGNYGQALNVLSGINPEFIAENAEIAYHLGAVYAALGRLPEAQKYMEMAAPSVKEAKVWLKNRHQ